MAQGLRHRVRAGLICTATTVYEFAGQLHGYGYSPFRGLFAAWRGRLLPTMRQPRPLVERLILEYAGQTARVR
jgi:transposase